MFRLGIVLLSLLSVNAYAQDNKPAKHYQFGMEVQQYTVGSSDKGLKQYIDSNEFIDNYKGRNVITYFPKGQFKSLKYGISNRSGYCIFFR